MDCRFHYCAVGSDRFAIFYANPNRVSDKAPIDLFPRTWFDAANVALQRGLAWLLIEVEATKITIHSVKLDLEGEFPKAERMHLI
jgi:hypothetical protein